MTYMGKRLLTLCSWRSETSQLSTTVKDEATVDALWMCVHLAWSMLYRQIGYPLGEIYHIGVASTLLVQQEWAMRGQ